MTKKKMTRSEYYTKKFGKNIIIDGEIPVFSSKKSLYEPLEIIIDEKKFVFDEVLTEEFINGYDKIYDEFFDIQNLINDLNKTQEEVEAMSDEEKTEYENKIREYSKNRDAIRDSGSKIFEMKRKRIFYIFPEIEEDLLKRFDVHDINIIHDIVDDYVKGVDRKKKENF